MGRRRCLRSRRGQGGRKAWGSKAGAPAARAKRLVAPTQEFGKILSSPPPAYTTVPNTLAVTTLPTLKSPGCTRAPCLGVRTFTSITNGDLRVRAPITTQCLAAGTRALAAVECTSPTIHPS
eukprot:2222540-Pyramimonas_sp.AAC.1